MPKRSFFALSILLLLPAVAFAQTETGNVADETEESSVSPPAAETADEATPNESASEVRNDVRPPEASAAQASPTSPPAFVPVQPIASAPQPAPVKKAISPDACHDDANVCASIGGVMNNRGFGTELKLQVSVPKLFNVKDKPVDLAAEGSLGAVGNYRTGAAIGSLNADFTRERWFLGSGLNASGQNTQVHFVRGGIKKDIDVLGKKVRGGLSFTPLGFDRDRVNSHNGLFTGLGVFGRTSLLDGSLRIASSVSCALTFRGGRPTEIDTQYLSDMQRVQTITQTGLRQDGPGSLCGIDAAVAKDVHENASVELAAQAEHRSSKMDDLGFDGKVLGGHTEKTNGGTLILRGKLLF
jgi:hypothetical protein